MTSNKLTMLKKFDGDEEAYKAYMHELASKGGSKKVKKGMGVLTPEERSERGRQRAMARWGNKDATDNTRPSTEPQEQ